jgi:hypothetical protein
MAAEPPRDDRPLSIEELRALLRREKSDSSLKRWLAGTLIVVMVLFAGVAGKLIQTVNRDQRISDRQDCAREYSSLLGAKTNVAVFAGLEQLSQLGQALFDSTAKGMRPTQVKIDAFGVISAQVESALDVAAGRNGHPKLPTADQAVDHGMTLDGTKYPACPTVG